MSWGCPGVEHRAIKYPVRLKLLDGLKWRGHLTLIGSHGDRYLVDWDAEDTRATHERHIMDRAVLTPKQVRDWTGWDDAQPPEGT